MASTTDVILACLRPESTVLIMDPGLIHFRMTVFYVTAELIEEQTARLFNKYVIKVHLHYAAGGVDGPLVGEDFRFTAPPDTRLRSKR